MALVEDVEALSRAFSGIGIDEKSIISIVGKWHPEHTDSFRKGSVLLWTMHPWERDARMIKESLIKGPQSYGVIIEIACTRSSEQLLGARKAYHSLFDRSIEEDVAQRISDINRNFFVALVSPYRYEGTRVNEETAKSEAKVIASAIKNSGDGLVKNAEVLRILATRSKLYLKELSQGEWILRNAIGCLCSPPTYFSKILDMALNVKADEHTKDALTRVVVTRADTDMKEINEEYQKLYGIPLSQKIEEKTNGNYKDFLLTLVARGN
ncbi:hypothetical protein IFM89_013919 [Coptis chinensis]|uniref:Annexin n=1 Tax=Coptis chinensis TaxID=261450 RepID=A0A835HCS1_9MAGN|nr:hypothetical protein IFM89_013919 [Coptis chinensis]